MTTWTIKAYRPQMAGDQGNTGFESAPEDTGLRLDDTVTLTSFTPGMASTATIMVQKTLESMQTYWLEGKGGGWLLCADNGSGTIIKPYEPFNSPAD